MSHAPAQARIRQAFAPALVALALAGCATQQESTPDPMAQYQALAGLQNGQLRLVCGLSCAGSWSLARTALKGLHAHGLWADLATEVARIGFSTDLSYFYLARATEGLGKPQAADVYYRLALAGSRKCDGWVFDSCDGVNVPLQASAALDRLAGKAASSGEKPPP
jgi:hypothetical protein